jgi:hypothetical protein
VPRVPSIRLRLARVNGRVLERFERELERNPERLLDVKEAQVLLNLAKADALIRDRVPSKEEEEDLEDREKRKDEQAKDLVAKLTGARQLNPTAKVFRGDDDDDAST